VTTNSPRKANVLFRAAAVLAAAFCATVLALVATTFGGGGAPVAKFLNEHGGKIIAVEVAATLCCAWGAMMLDRWHTLRDERARQVAESVNPAGDDETD